MQLKLMGTFELSVAEILQIKWAASDFYAHIDMQLDGQEYQVMENDKFSK